MRVLDLFSGIGGFSLGLERAGMETVAFCEIEPFCQKVLRKHWPDVPIYDDVTKLLRGAWDMDVCPDGCDEPFCVLCGLHYFECGCVRPDGFEKDVGEVDVITAGFPCQDISLLNSINGESLGAEHGERSGLWREVIRLAGILRPKYIVLENVPALLVRGFDGVLNGLAQIGYDCEWHCIPASVMGADHLRERVWIIAHDSSIGIQGVWPKGVKIPHGHDGEALSVRGSDGQWEAEPDLLRATDGVSARVDRTKRIKAIGNAVVPQIPEIIGRAIMEQS